MKGYEIVIGIEVHAELKTKTKIFCSCKTDFGSEPNTQVCPVCLGLPGTLPTLNHRAVELGAMAGLALGCEISKDSRFDRKNYFYPDLPKGYQISQFDRPLCENGSIEIETENGRKKIGITRIHLEEDAGKLLHRGDKTLIDCNRCGVPLIEIVSEPDMRSAAEAVAYLKKLRSILLFANISDCKMNEGSLRCDVNLSVRKEGEPMGQRSELKNLNSFKFIEKAIDYEAKRQIEAIERGEKIVPQTRRFDEKDLKTYFMREKETQRDYRFFREPDLPPVILTDEEIEALRRALPPLPDERREIYVNAYGLSLADASVLTLEAETADYFEAAAKGSRYPKICANFIITELMGIMEAGDSPFKIEPSHIASLSELLGDETINSATAKKLIARMWEKDFDPEKAVKEEGLAQINDKEALLTFARSAIEKCEKAVSDYKKGKATAIKSIIGKAMAESRGRANPTLMAAIVEELLSKI